MNELKACCQQWITKKNYHVLPIMLDNMHADDTSIGTYVTSYYYLKKFVKISYHYRESIATK